MEGKHLLKGATTGKLIRALRETLGYMKILNPHLLEEVLNVALSTGLAAYAASYIMLTKKGMGCHL